MSVFFIKISFCYRKLSETQKTPLCRHYDGFRLQLQDFTKKEEPEILFLATEDHEVFLFGLEID